MIILVGDTGFVGSNLVDTMDFDETYNSKNIINAYRKEPDILVYAGVRGTKFIANKYPEEDYKNIEDATYNIKMINPKKLILISTVDVYDDLDGKDESYKIDDSRLHTYGKNRYHLEQWVISNLDDYHIIRLPAIYGNNLKKNFVHDLINPAPPYLTSEKYFELLNLNKLICEYYTLNGDVYHLNNNDKVINDFFRSSVFNSLSFTDSKSEYQYFNLFYLHSVIEEVIKKNIKILNCVTEPIISSELYEKIYGQEFNNNVSDNPIKYNLMTNVSLDYFNVSNNYLINKSVIFNDLVSFIEGSISNE